MGRLLRRVGKWIDDQTGMISVLHEFMDEPLPEKVGWPHTLGSAVLVTFLIQLVTGAFMMVYYVPSPDHAHETVEYIQQLPFGQIVRGLHHFGATAMVVLIGLHLLQVFVWGAYKHPRQMIWVIGLGLLAVTFAFSFTGYLLPWDQKAYWATVVGTNIAGSIPHLGPFLRAALRGGEAVGAVTLTRFFTVHVFALPVLLELLIVFHIYQVRHHGLTPPWAVGEPDSMPTPQRFFPDQIFKDCVVALVLLGVLLFFAVTRGAPLESMANPSDTTYLPRPEWYFLPVYEILKYLPGKYGEFIGAVVIPTLGFVVLLVFPYLDRNPHRVPWRRPVAMSMMVLAFAVVTVFGVQGLKSTPPKTKLGATAKIGEKVYMDKHCDACHPINGVGGNVAPDLAHSPKRDAKVLEDLLRHPSSFHRRSIMPSVNLPPDRMAALVRFLLEIGPHYEYTRVPQVGPKKPSSHFEENWFLAHKFEVRKDPGYCHSCHKPAFCQGCHQRRRPDSHLQKWLRYHYGVATERPDYCKACHLKSFCDKCHALLRHGKDWTVRHGSVATTKRDLCRQCHRDATCRMCHQGARPRSHRSKNWLEKHGHSQALRQCNACHGHAFCQNCHMGAKPTSHTPDWQRTHAQPARLGRQKCTACHSPSFCNACHGVEMPHSTAFKSRKHGDRARRGAEVCFRCHKQSTCTDCHGLPLPHPKGWKTKTHPAVARKTPVCSKCHTPKDCGKCHDADNPPENHFDDNWDATHGKVSVGRKTFCALCHGKNGCVDCHGLPLPHPKGWKTKTHPAVARKTPVCSKCHTPKDCGKCHDADNPPENHFDDNWDATHGKAAGGHDTYCRLCHARTTCDNCHRQRRTGAADARPEK